MLTDVTLCCRATPNARHYTLNYNKPQTSSKPGGDTLQLLRVRGGSCVGSYQPIRYIAEWNTKRSVVGFTKIETIVVLFSLGTFMVYFMYLRESSDIDEYISQPIWKRVPGIDPERAEQMMLVDKHFGLQVDFSELEQYKRDYYAQKLADLEQEKQEIQRHQELRHSKNPHERPDEQRQGPNPHQAMLLRYAQKIDVMTDQSSHPENDPN